MKYSCSHQIPFHTDVTSQCLSLCFFSFSFPSSSLYVSISGFQPAGANTQSNIKIKLFSYLMCVCMCVCVCVWVSVCTFCEDQFCAGVWKTGVQYMPMFVRLLNVGYQCCASLFCEMCNLSREVMIISIYNVCCISPYTFYICFHILTFFSCDRAQEPSWEPVICILQTWKTITLEQWQQRDREHT